MDGGSQPERMRGIKYRIRLGKAGQTNFGHLFCNFGQIGNFGHFCGSSIALRRENVRFGCPKMLNGVVFTIFIPFSFSAISLYETHRRRCEMGFFHNLFVRLQPKPVLCSATGPLFTSVPGVVSQRAACVRVQPWYGVRMPCYCVLGGT